MNPFRKLWRGGEQKSKTKNPNYWSWNSYLEQIKTTYSSKTPIEEVRFVVLDTETTGLDYRKDQILSIGAVTIEKMSIQVGTAFECYVFQEYNPEVEATQVHGILPKSESEALSEEEALLSLLAYIRNSVLIGHHLGFDLLLLNKGISALFGDSLKNKFVDTAQLSERLGIAANDKSLDTLCKVYGIELHDRHTAVGDAFLTAQLFLKIFPQLQEMGIATLGDLLRSPIKKHRW